MIKTKQLTRICTSCGMEKPLSAFLQMGPQGTSYGAICITCRNQKTKKSPTDEAFQEEGDETTLPPKNRIGTKQKASIDKEQNRQIKDLKDLLKQDLKRKEELSHIKLEKKWIENKSYKKHHQLYLDKKIEDEKPLEEKKAMTFLQTQKVIASERNFVEQKIKEEIFLKETREAGTDFNRLNHFITPGKLEYQSASFLRFQALIGRPLLGPASTETAKKPPPIVRVMQQFYGDHAPNPAEKKSLQKNDPAAAEKKGKEIAQSISNWGPKRGR